MRKIILFIPLVPIVSLCGTLPLTSCNRGEKGLHFKDLKVGDDLSDKLISFDMTKTWCNHANAHDYIDFNNGGALYALTYGPVPQTTSLFISYKTSHIEISASYPNDNSPFWADSLDSTPGCFIIGSHNRLLCKFQCEMIITQLSLDTSIENDALNDYMSNDVLFQQQ